MAVLAPLQLFAQSDDEEEFTQTSRPANASDDVAKAVEAFNRGQDAHSKGDLELALTFYEEALRLLPEFPEAEYQVGSLMELMGNQERAESSYRRAISLKPEWTLPASALGSLLVAKGDYAGARPVLEKALEIDGLCVPCYPPLTEIYLNSSVPPDQLRTLLQKLTILTSKAKSPASVWAAKAAIERATGDVPAAQVSVARGIGLNPDDISALSEKVELQLLSGDSDGAVVTAKRIVSLDPESIPAKIRLARAEHAAGRTDEAVSILEPLSDSSPVARAALASIRETSSEDPSKLIEMLQDSPNDAAILGRLCTALRREDPERALDYCLRASQADPTNINHAVGYGAALLQQRKYAEAATLLNRIKGMAPENYTVRANLATALFQLGRFDLAIAEYKWIIEDQPDLPVAYYFLGISLDRTESYVEALAAYRKFLDLAGDEDFREEVSRVELRLPILERQIKQGKGKN